MKTKLLTLLLGGAIASGACAQTLLWKDNFDVANNTSFDAAPLTGRLSGTLAADVVARADGTQQQILNNQLRLINNRIRFQVPPNGVRYDWAAGAGAGAIAAAGGIQISFDWVPVNNTDTNWVNVSVGFPLGFTGQRVTAGDTDYGVLLRNNGGSQRFSHGLLGTGGNFPATLTSRHVVYNYAFSSFADTTPVKAQVLVDGVEVALDEFTWDGNGGTFAWVLETHVNGHSIDNLSFSTAPPALFYEVALDESGFSSGIPSGGAIGNFTAGTFAFGAEASTFTLAAGAGDTDNAKFQIVGGELQSSGTHDFKLDADGTQYSIRVNGTGGTSGGVSEDVYILTMLSDDDSDGILDAFELAYTGNITDLNGLLSGPGPGAGTGDFDGDGLTDLQEYNLSLAAYPLIDPTLADTDADTLSDFDELNPSAPRPVTNPTLADTDGDTLSDLVETNTGTFVSAANTGSNPTLADSDTDGLDDGFETTNNPPYDPNVDNSADDFDGDGLDVTAELAAGSDVLLADTDSDTINDGDEVNGVTNPYQLGALAGDPPTVAPGAPTSPILADTDVDGIDDNVEISGSNGFVTNPNLADSDGDGLLDGFEVAQFPTYDPIYNPNVDDSSEDTDGDTLTTAEEVAAGTSVILADTDGDGLDDGEELYPLAPRVVTNPLAPDTDFDGLTDLEENNSGIYNSATDTGTDAINQDTDFDGARDGYEVANGTDVYVDSSYPGPMGGVTVAKLTAEGLTGISTTKTYTHKISGGGAATVNGVVFDQLSPGVIPANFAWAATDINANPNTYNAIAPINNGDWQPATGNVTGAGLLQLLGGFSFSGNGAEAGDSQRYTLSGLTPGENYVFRLYSRVWDTEGSGRPHDLVLTNGPQVVQPFSAMATDRPGFVTGTGNHHDAYYLEFAYQADGTQLVIDSTVPLGAYGTAGEGTSGSLHMYGLTNEVAGNAVYAVASTGDTFKSGAFPGDLVATLTGYIDAVPEASTFALVSGTGDTDNAKFQISGNELQVLGDFTDATGIAATEGQQFFVRVQGNGSGSAEIELVLTVSKDDDLDDLPDGYEMTWAGNITDLDGTVFGPGPGAGTGDFDGDGLADIDEYQLSLGIFPGFPTYATINPIVADTDGDGLSDGEELFPTTSRYATNPLVVDTDGDGLSDFVETGTGIFVDANDTGTDGFLADTDGDGVPDGVEVNNGSDPNDAASFLPAAIAAVKLTGDATSGIDVAKTYTHLISGGNAATVNGVTFEALTTTVTPLGLVWNVNGSTKSQVTDNLGAWNSTAVGLNGTGLEQLLDSFVYSGGTPGVKQTYTLSGLTMGETYQFRLYIRRWGAADTRPQLFVITNGSQVFDPMLALPEDQPGQVLGNGDNNCAYYIAFDYTADSTTLVLDATVPNPANGGFHMYAMSNEVTVPVGGGLKITNVTRSAIGEIVIDFEGAPSTFYDVKKSTTLVGAFATLTSPLTVMTNGSGIGQAIVPAAEASELAEYYRIEAQ